MSDQYYSAIQAQWSNIRGLYVAYGSKKPIMLYDIHDNKIYAYPYKEFRAELSERSQASLEIDYMFMGHRRFFPETCGGCEAAFSSARAVDMKREIVPR